MGRGGGGYREEEERKKYGERERSTRINTHRRKPTPPREIEFAFVSPHTDLIIAPKYLIVSTVFFVLSDPADEHNACLTITRRGEPTIALDGN